MSEHTKNDVVVGENRYYKRFGEWSLKGKNYDSPCDDLDPFLDEIERLKRILRHVASNNPSWADPDMECRTCNDIIKEFGQ